MQIAGLVILSLLPGMAALSGTNAQLDAESAEYYRTFVRDMKVLSRNPPRKLDDVRAAARRLMTFDHQALSRGFIAESALRTADGRPLPATRPSARPPLADMAAVLHDTIDEMTHLSETLTALGDGLMAHARSRQAAREGRPAPAQARTDGTSPVPPAGKPEPLAMSLFAQIIERAKQISSGGHTPRAAGTEGNEHLERCLRIQRLNLRQCLAAAHFADEEMFCTAHHGFTELGICWGKYF